jgi:hypothetical protein
MAIKVYAPAKVTNGSLVFSKPDQVRNDLESLEGKAVHVTVEKQTRSLQQNALYWACCQRLAKELGWLPDEIHEYNKEHCNAQTRSLANQQTGEVSDIRVPGSTARLALDAFSEYLEKCNAFWGELGYEFLINEDNNG